ncbi:hypothetical protein G6F35_019072 [Rhizopus arrhizus]|nr:hypothetical protein G6F35_019072 [Rhizopus arrhizus]
MRSAAARRSHCTWADPRSPAARNSAASRRRWAGVGSSGQFESRRSTSVFAAGTSSPVAACAAEVSKQ